LEPPLPTGLASPFLTHRAGEPIPQSQGSGVHSSPTGWAILVLLMIVILPVVAYPHVHCAEAYLQQQLHITLLYTSVEMLFELNSWSCDSHEER